MQIVRKLDKNDNELKRVQKILLNQMNRLDDQEVMNHNGKREMQRSSAISQNASAYIKSVLTQIKILELSNKVATTEQINEYLGIIKND